MAGDIRFKALLDDLWAMHQKKSADYGCESDALRNYRRSERLGVEPWRGCVIRCSDKWSRIETYAETGELANESFEDALMDNAAHSLIALILWREEQEANARLEAVLEKAKEHVSARTSRYEDEPDGCHLCGGKGECEPGCMLDKKRGCVGPKSVIDTLRSTLGIHDMIAETETASVSMSDCRITVQEGDMPESGNVISPCAFLATKG